jgi:hypothetical protein
MAQGIFGSRIRVFPVFHSSHQSLAPSDAEKVVFSILRSDGSLAFLGDCDHILSEPTRAMVVIKLVEDGGDGGFREFRWVPQFLANCRGQGLELLGVLEAFGDESHLYIPVGPMPKQVAAWAEVDPELRWVFPWDLSEDVRSAAQSNQYQGLDGRVFFPDERASGDSQPFVRDIALDHSSPQAGWVACSPDREVIVENRSPEYGLFIDDGLINYGACEENMGTCPAAFFQSRGLGAAEIALSKVVLGEGQADQAPACVKEWIDKVNAQPILLGETGVKRVNGVSGATLPLLNDCECLEIVGFNVASQEDWQAVVQLPTKPKVVLDFWSGFRFPSGGFAALLNWLDVASDEDVGALAELPGMPVGYSQLSQEREIRGLSDEQLRSGIDSVRGDVRALSLAMSVRPEVLLMISKSPFVPPVEMATPRHTCSIRDKAQRMITTAGRQSRLHWLEGGSFCREAGEIAEDLDWGYSEERDCFALKKRLEMMEVMKGRGHIQSQLMQIGGVSLGDFLKSSSTDQMQVSGLQDAIGSAAKELRIDIRASFHESSLGVPEGWSDWFVKYFWLLSRACAGRVGTLVIRLEADWQTVPPLFFLRGLELFDQIDAIEIEMACVSPSEAAIGWDEILPHGELHSRHPELRFLRGAKRQRLKSLSIIGGNGAVAAPLLPQDFQALLPKACEFEYDQGIFDLPELSAMRCNQCHGRSFNAKFTSDWEPLASFFHVSAEHALTDARQGDISDWITSTLESAESALDALEVGSYGDLLDLEEDGVIEVSQELSSASGRRPFINSISCNSCGAPSDGDASQLSGLLARSFDDEFESMPWLDSTWVSATPASFLRGVEGPGTKRILTALEQLRSSLRASSCPDCHEEVRLSVKTVWYEFSLERIFGEIVINSNHPMYCEMDVLDSIEKHDDVHRLRVKNTRNDTDAATTVTLRCEQGCWEVSGGIPEFMSVFE